MNSPYHHLLLAAHLFCSHLACLAQPQWRFHLAFEDGTGARDTIWMVYDTAATNADSPWPGPNVDVPLGEGPVYINESIFQVFTYNALGQQTKTDAFPYSAFPYFFGTIVDAINWVIPLTIRWDTSLFNAPYLPYDQGSIGQAYLGGDYFFFHSNDGSKLGFNMLLTDHVVVEDAFLLFPTGAGWGPGNWLSVDRMESDADRYTIGPVPADDRLNVRSNEVLGHLRIVDQLGRTVHRTHHDRAEASIDVSGLLPGTYVLVGEEGTRSGRPVVFWIAR